MSNDIETKYNQLVMMLRETAFGAVHDRTAADPESRYAFDVLTSFGIDTKFCPPASMDVTDKYGGFSALNEAGDATVWVLGHVAVSSTGTLVEDSVYRNLTMVSAHYKVPGWSRPAVVTWTPGGRRLA